MNDHALPVQKHISAASHLKMIMSGKQVWHDGQ